MNLIPCDITTHSFAVMLRECNIHPKYVIHAGAHDLIEADIYDSYKSRVWAIECNPFVYPKLTYRLNNLPNQTPIFACLWSENNAEKEFMFYRNREDGAGGLYAPEKMFAYITDCPLTGESITCVTTTMDTICRKYIKDYYLVDFLNVDLQGAELEFFKGASLLLKSESLKSIWCEVSWDHVYKDGPLLTDIDKYLGEYGFTRFGVRRDWEIHGDALYVRQ